VAQNEDPVPSPNFGIFARVLIAEAVKKVQVAYPAIVTAYYPPNTTTKDPAMVDVQIARKYARQIDHLEDALPGETTREDAEHGLLALADMTPVPRVVVQYPGFGGMRITGPVPVGEEGLLVTCTRSIDRWVRRGADPVQDPVFQHAMNLKDSIFLPGLRSGADVGFDIVPEAGWRLGADDASWELFIDADTHGVSLTTDGPDMTLDAETEIKIGADATSFAAKADLVDAKFDEIKTTIAAITPAVDPASAVTAVNAILTFFDTWPTSSVAATKAKVE